MFYGPKMRPQQGGEQGFGDGARLKSSQSSVLEMS